MANKTQPNNYSLRWTGSQRRIGITGGIATGKTTISNCLKKLTKWPILDTDIYAKEALNPDNICTKEVIDRYGEKIVIDPKKGRNLINRQLLSEIIFNDQNERLWIENRLYPIIITRLKEELRLYKDHKVVVIIIPLLFEVGLNTICSEVWVVSCELEQQLKRLMSRDDITKTEAKKRILAQWSLNRKIALADFILDNNGKFNSLKEQIKNII